MSHGNDSRPVVDCSAAPLNEVVVGADDNGLVGGTGQTDDQVLLTVELLNGDVARVRSHFFEQSPHGTTTVLVFAGNGVEVLLDFFGRGYVHGTLDRPESGVQENEYQAFHGNQGT